MDVASWGAAATASEAAQKAELAAACDAGDAVACDNLSKEEEAKQAWLTKLDVPSWGAAATALASGASEAAQMAEMTASCNAGDAVACDNLSREEEAKRKWQAKMDVGAGGEATRDPEPSVIDPNK